MTDEFDNALRESLSNNLYNTVINVSDVIRALTEARMMSGLTFTEISKMSGVSTRRLKKFECLHRVPSLIDLCAVLAVYGKELRVCQRPE